MMMVAAMMQTWGDNNMVVLVLIWYQQIKETKIWVLSTSIKGVFSSTKSIQTKFDIINFVVSNTLKKL